MAGDKRAFALLDVGYMDNPKVMDVFDASRNAFCMHLASILYCAQHLTDGLVSSKMIQRKVGGSDADTQLLIDAGLWHKPGHECPDCPEVGRGKVYVHDYLQHNRRSEAVKGKSIAAAKAAHHRWNRNAERNAERIEQQYETHSEQQSENNESAVPKKERKKEVKDSSISDEEFDRWYAKYPRKEAKAAARRAFAKARKTVDVDTLIAGLERYVVSVKGKERQYIALPASWLNAGRWEDEYAPLPQHGSQQVLPMYAAFNQ